MYSVDGTCDFVLDGLFTFMCCFTVPVKDSWKCSVLSCHMLTMFWWVFCVFLMRNIKYILYDMTCLLQIFQETAWIGLVAPTTPPPKYANKLTVISTHLLHYITGRNVLTFCCREYCKGHHKWFISELSNEMTCHSDP